MSRRLMFLLGVALVLVVIRLAVEFWPSPSVLVEVREGDYVMQIKDVDGFVYAVAEEVRTDFGSPWRSTVLIGPASEIGRDDPRIRMLVFNRVQFAVGRGEIMFDPESRTFSKPSRW